MRTVQMRFSMVLVSALVVLLLESAVALEPSKDEELKPKSCGALASENFNLCIGLPEIRKTYGKETNDLCVETYNEDMEICCNELAMKFIKKHKIEDKGEQEAIFLKFRDKFRKMPKKNNSETLD